MKGSPARSREILIRTKDIAEEMGFTVLHGIVDCLWVQGVAVEMLKQTVEKEIGIQTEIEHFNWIVFLPMNDGSGAYNRYFGRLSDGSVKVRGIAARRHDTPEFVRSMQGAMLEVMAGAGSITALTGKEEVIRTIFCTAVRCLPDADPRALVIHRRISRLTYAHRCLEGAAVQAYRDRGIEIAPGMKIGYIVRDARRYAVDTGWDATGFDLPYYQNLLEKAWEEIAFAFQGIFLEEKE